MWNYHNYTQYIRYSQEVKYDTLCVEGHRMISYKPFYDTLLKKNITEYQLIFKQGVSANTLHRMKKGLPITTKTLDTLCFVLNCEVQDILVHDKENNTEE